MIGNVSSHFDHKYRELNGTAIVAYGILCYSFHPPAPCVSHRNFCRRRIYREWAEFLGEMPRIYKDPRYVRRLVRKFLFLYIIKLVLFFQSFEKSL